ncbi:leucine-rich repeat protein soc-2 homolog [Ostrea edulis]|uniref:leucine-rich repeat protein soc-2 homolog n=1 Tax=Ostrea edulis TaxID=37623 RepID=UPI002095894B|nr:leucine-rich repeat protein soc-2 homolog [Ostrea edulis]XP_048734687.1 leucine-rich repeat protein soc-2 homolog [Ostrea edulis]XP_048734688.1 leucine-rich repeat protein soc-2 homolog [Ostrea edulis]
MSGYFYQYITVVVRDFIFFYDDVQSTTIAVAIASSLCCSIVWAICHLLTLGSSTCRSTKVNRSTFLTTNHAVAKSRRRMSPRNSTSSEDETAVYEEIEVPCVQCGQYIADYTCRFVTCNICCLAPSSCSTHHASENHRRPYNKKKKGVTEINLSKTDITECPHRMGYIGPQLTLLNLSYNNLCHIPAEIGCLRGLEELLLNNNNISSIPDSIGSLVNLKVLKLSHNHLKSLPESLTSLSNLVHLDVRKNKLHSLPAGVGSLIKLSYLKMGSNSIQHIPKSLYKLQRMKVLKMERNKIDNLSGAVSNMLELEYLNLSHCQLSTIPRELGSCSALRKLDISNNRIADLPAHFGQLRGLTRLNLARNKLRYIPSTLLLSSISDCNVSDNDFISTEHSITCIPLICKIPPLLELSARATVQHHSHHYTSDLPLSLQNLITNRKYCVNCYRPCFLAFQMTLTFQKLSNIDIPVVSVTCSSCSLGLC